MTMMMPEPEPLRPVPGLDAFLQETPSAIASRAGQLLGMAAYAFGRFEPDTALREDADLLGVPHVERAGDEMQRWSSDARLDDLTRQAQEFHDLSSAGSLDERTRALWGDVVRFRTPMPLLALLNIRQQSEHPLEAAAAAAALHAFSGGRLNRSHDILRSAAESADPQANAVAAAMLDVSRTSPDVPERPAWVGNPVSTTIHGTWALVEENGWHRPGSPLHSHLRAKNSANLYDADGYFVWSGEYSDLGRTQGGEDLHRWADLVSGAGWLDAVYAHSHGGNVALDALAKGARIKLLVLLHTPAIHRTSQAWAAIRANVGGVISMRTRMDHVVLADSLRHGENRMAFDPELLPHFPVVGHWKNQDAWFSHSHFVSVSNWRRSDLSNIVTMRYRAI
ncbi:hypothetical protein [Microbacterium oxydans]|uniref:Alpha/beta hydrolase n=1 Tax=Microbacterium oxydans TaxID=82380 RepID=A0A0F0LF29_9MICO|nr:hypothetical protein [Microbacterium oxydans]KJL30156.1 hypothetical protein RS83_00906 [Microbacterium oxydans]